MRVGWAYLPNNKFNNLKPYLHSHLDFLKILNACFLLQPQVSFLHSQPCLAHSQLLPSLQPQVQSLEHSCLHLQFSPQSQPQLQPQSQANTAPDNTTDADKTNKPVSNLFIYTAFLFPIKYPHGVRVYNKAFFILCQENNKKYSLVQNN